MRIAVCFLYVLLQIFYLLPILPETRGSYAFGIIIHIAFVGFLLWDLERGEEYTLRERLFFQLTKYLSVANCIYLVLCAYYDTKFAVLNTPIFAYILGIGFVVLMYYCIRAKI